MKYLIVFFISSAFIACKEKKEPPKTEPDIFETRSCDYVLPEGYKMLCHDKRNIYVIQVNDTNYLSWQYRAMNKSRYYIVQYSYYKPQKLTGEIHYNDFEHAIKFDDSCKAKGYVKQLIIEAEDYRVKDSTYRANAHAKHIADSIKNEEETFKHFKECTK